jgi:hypothetical protein
VDGGERLSGMVAGRPGCIRCVEGDGLGLARDGWGHDHSAPWGEKGGKTPTDCGKIGTKRSLLTEGGGVPVGLAVAGANRTDFKMARATLTSISSVRPEPTPDKSQGMSMDKGDDDEVRELLAEFGCTAHSRARGEEAKALKQAAGCKAWRWVVARTHSWRNRFRRVLIRWDKTVCHYIGFLHLACAYITYRPSGLLG